MDITIKTYLIVCPLIFLGGFIDSVAGGGGTITIPAYIMAGLPVHFAAGTNKVVAGIGCSTAAAKYFANGKIRWLVAVFAAIGALIGGYAGAEIAKSMSESLLRGLMLAVLPAVAIFLALKKDLGKESAKEKEMSVRRKILISLAIGLGIGIYDGIMGPGTGTFMIMAFSAFLSLELVTASGCAKVANLASDIAAAVAYVRGGFVVWQLVLPAALFSIAGNYFGAAYAVRGGSKKIRAMIFVVLGMLFIKVMYDLISKK